MTPSTLTGQLRTLGELTRADRQAMLALLEQHFEGVDAETFQADLAEKDRVILLRDEAGQVRGFSTLKSWRERLGGRPVRVLFSGDTVVDRGAWGSPVLPRTWLKAALEERARCAPGERLFWLLISSGYRTYRFLPVFFECFWPRHDRGTPEEVQALMDTLARRRYGGLYARGVVRLPGGACVREEVGGLTPERLRNPHVACFARLNPGYTRGDELVCLTEVAPENFTAAAQRQLEALMAERCA
ncbi:MAG: hypothetical protein H6741_08940 [Alphaproteobacteria bacterium]|nr:hypothetical protein [Alphaproteobacteria bacterium]MCB9792839.1 hypothetical protein [Alphaproteobacteria bacterium]